MLASALLALSLAEGACPHDLDAWPALSLDDLPALDPGQEPDTVQLPGDLLGSLVVTCDAQGCAGEVTTTDATGAVRGRATLPEPAQPWEVDGLQILGSGLRDMDGDGRADWVVRYTLTEPPRAAVGSWFNELFAVYRLPDLALLWSATARRVGGDSEPASACTLRLAPDGRGAALRCLHGPRDAVEGDPSSGEITCERWRPRRPR